MHVELGNPTPHQCATVGGVHTHVPIPGNPGPTFTRAVIDYDLADDLDIGEVALHLVHNSDVTSMVGIRALLSIVHPTSGLWIHHSSGGSKPTWVYSDNPTMERYLSEWYGCPAGRPDDLEDTHYTYHGPPGVGPGSVTERAGE